MSVFKTISLFPGETLKAMPSSRAATNFSTTSECSRSTVNDQRVLNGRNIGRVHIQQQRKPLGYQLGTLSRVEYGRVDLARFERLHQPWQIAPDLHNADLIPLGIESEVLQSEYRIDPEARADSGDAESFSAKVSRRLDVRPGDYVVVSTIGLQRDKHFEISPLRHRRYHCGDSKYAERNVARVIRRDTLPVSSTRSCASIPCFAKSPCS